jgi:hypothetical protein
LHRAEYVDRSRRDLLISLKITKDLIKRLSKEEEEEEKLKASEILKVKSEGIMQILHNWMIRHLYVH